MIFILDNYDSFTYNLVQYLMELAGEVVVKRNDEITVEGIRALKPKKIVISPGPCTPKKAGISMDVVRAFQGKIPILGVCLGHQSIMEALGGKIIHAQKLVHGKTSSIRHDGKGVFKGLPNPFDATRYHSLAVDSKTLPEQLMITAHSEDGEIMGIRHKEFAMEGVQFHPESILTECGKDLLANFLKM
jgi:anthranilate synthase/aminodeoxychorismate synthase-like glutamine amidotransferase